MADITRPVERWFTQTWPDDGEYSFLIPYLPDDEYEQILEKNTTIKKKETKVDDKQFAVDLFDRCCKDWKGEITVDGKQAECNPENKLMALINKPHWARFCVQTARNSEFYAHDFEEIKKKSEMWWNTVYSTLGTAQKPTAQPASENGKQLEKNPTT